MERSPDDSIPDTTATVAPARPGRFHASTYQGRVYEDDLNADSRWALSEGSNFFEGESRVQQTLAKFTRKLNELGIPYCVVGGMALFQHGYRRFTEDVDILVTKEDLKKIHAKLSGLGYLPPFNRSKNLRDTELGVRIEFLVAGEYPGDGKPKPVAFPDPLEAGIDREGVRYLSLPRLVELKLASGMTNPDRMKDITDAYELIKLLNLPRDFGTQLDSFVKQKFDELWQQSRKRYTTIWRNKWLTAEAKSIEEMITLLRGAAEELEVMRREGVTLDPEGGTSDDYAYLVTTDPAVAKRFDMHDESELWGDEEETEEENEGANPDLP